MERVRSRVQWWFLPLILAGAGVLRFAALPSRGFVYWDEGKFALEGVRLLSVLHALPVVGSSSLEGKAIGTAKPTHALLIALSYAVLGVHDYGPLLMDAACSVAAIGILYVLASRMFGAVIGLVAAALLAVSGYDIVYARSALSESDADLLFLVGVLCWWHAVHQPQNPVRSRCGPYFCAGAIMGLALTTNYRLLVFIGTLAAVDLVRITLRDDRRAWLLAVLAGAGGLLILPVLWQVIGMAAYAHGAVLFRGEVTYRPSSYFSELMYQLHGGRQSVIHFQPIRYLQWYVVRQGWPTLALGAVGLVVASRERSLRGTVCVALVLVPYAVYAFAPFIVPRNLDAALPFAAVLTALGVNELVKWGVRVTLRLRTVALVTLVLMIFSAARDLPVVGLRSGFARASVYVSREHSPGALAANEIMRFYLRDTGRGCAAPRLPSTPSGVLMAQRSGNQFAVIDQYHRVVERYLARHARLVAQFPATSRAPFGENLISSENGNPPSSGPIPSVDVYALDGLRGRLPSRLVHPSCTLDQLS